MGVRVAIVRCDSYDQEPADRAVRQALDGIEGLDKIIRAGTRVLLKVNLISARPPEDAVTTHPAIVSALIDAIRDLGGDPFVAEECGFAYPGATKRAARKSGIQELVERKQTEFIPLDSVGFTKTAVPAGARLQSVYYSDLVREAEVLVSVPKLKNHTQTIFTGAVKNMFGCVPTQVRMEAHRLSKYVEFSESVVDIYSVKVPHLAVMDAVWGMEGNGPTRGNPRKLGLVMASRDCVALDAAACAVVGFRPFDVVTTRSASERGLGEGRLDQIEVVGESIANVALQDFKKPSTRFLNLPTWFGNMLYGRMAARPIINSKRCKKCKVCYKTCPVSAVVPANKYYVDHDKCIRCYCCHELCPEDAVTLKETIMGRLLGGS
jgi:uncharacterized protein (DUF362 family)/NAD-dependent dihydropyrimidine dehydrogenase PreA subunit